jgi:protease I
MDQGRYAPQGKISARQGEGWYSYPVMSKKILLVTGDGGEGYEVLYGYHRFLEAGMEPVIAAPASKRLNLVMHDFEPGWDTYIERPGYCVQAEVAIDDVQADSFDAILIMGGRAPEYLRHNRRLIDLVRHMHKQGKWVCAICHGIQVLVAAGIVKGRRVTCYEHVRFEVEMAGGTYDTCQAVRDGRIITAQTWQSHPEFYRELFSSFAEAG